MEKPGGKRKVGYRVASVFFLGIFSWALFFWALHLEAVRDRAQKLLKEVFQVDVRWSGLSLSPFPPRLDLQHFQYTSKGRFFSLDLKNCTASWNPLSLVGQSFSIPSAGCQSAVIIKSADRAPARSSILHHLLTLARYLEIGSATLGQLSFEDRKYGLVIRGEQLRAALLASPHIAYLGGKRLSLSAVLLSITQHGKALFHSGVSGRADSLLPLFSSPGTFPKTQFSLTGFASDETSPSSLSASLDADGDFKINADLDWPLFVAASSKTLTRLAESHPHLSLEVEYEQAKAFPQGHYAASATLKPGKHTPEMPALAFEASAQYKGEKIEIKGGRLEVQDTKAVPPATTPSGTFTFDGALDLKTGWDLNLEAHAFPLFPAIAILSGEKLKGAVDFKTALKGPIARPETEFPFTAQHIAYLIFSGSRFSGNAALAPDTFTIHAAPEEAKGAFSLALVLSDLYDKTKRRLTLDVTAEKTPWRLLFAPQLLEPHLSGTFHFESEVGGGRNQKKGAGEFSLVDFHWGDLRIDRLGLSIAVETEGPTFAVTSLVTNAEPLPLPKTLAVTMRKTDTTWRLAGTPLPGAKVEFTWPRKQPAAMDGFLTLSDFSLYPFISQWSWARFRPLLRAEGRVRIPFGNPRQTSFSLRGSAVHFEGDMAPFSNTGSFSLRLDEGAFSIDGLALKGADSAFSLDVHAPIFSGPPLELSLKGRIGANLLAAWYPDTIAGQGALEANLRFQPKQGALNGDLSFHDLSLALSPTLAPLVLENGSLALRSAGDENPEKRRLSLICEAINGTWEGGSFAVSGNYDYRGGKPAGGTLHMNFDNLPISREDTFEIRLAGNLLLDANGISGQVDIAEGTYYRRFQLFDYVLRPNASEAAPFSLPGWDALENLRLNVEIRDRNTLFVDNNIAKLTLGADIRLGGTAANPRLDGHLEVREGQIHFMGLVFDETEGEVLWRRDLFGHPQIHITGSREVADYTVRADISGKIDNLKITFDSDPPLSPNEVFQVLFTGQVPEQGSDWSEDYFSTQFAAAQILTLTERPLAEFSGLDILSLETARYSRDPTIASDTRIQVGKRVSDRFSLNYSTSINRSDPVQAFALEYLLSDHFFLKAGKIDRNRYSFDLSIRFETD